MGHLEGGSELAAGTAHCSLCGCLLPATCMAEQQHHVLHVPVQASVVWARSR